MREDEDVVPLSCIVPSRLKIVHVVTLVTPEGAYGGPVRVATNLTKALNARGHESRLWAGARGYPKNTNLVDGAPARLFSARVAVPTLGFATTVVRGLASALIVERHRVDIVHIHLARDFVTLPIALLARAVGLPYVVQTHGMITRKSGIFARFFDTLLTRPALRGADRILYLTSQEQQSLSLVESRLTSFVQLDNGADIHSGAEPMPSHTGCEVLYLARMHPRKRPLMFVNAAVDILARGRDAEFRMVGPDEGEASAVSKRISDAGYPESIVYEGPCAPELTDDRLSKCDIYVLPSIDEPFPMSVLEAMALGKPVIVTDSCGLAPYIESAAAGIVVGSDQASLTSAVESLIMDSSAQHAMGERAKNLVKYHFSISGVAERLQRVYESCLASDKNVRPNP
ncbi:glycosyltransferase [Kocuria sp. UCD-OTCP]|uniref:glycosyltransferase n=1 Tax=Kocuria sp. UCD-OTCP TaxID=1292021 RepID=UPI0009D97F00|nr:glycosyltransferase [Kocuria sp. UCD-OTCP]